jgi:hypothetical protein
VLASFNVLSDDHDCDCFLAHSSSHAAAVAALDPLMIENGQASSSSSLPRCIQFIQMWRWPYISPSVIVTATSPQRSFSRPHPHGGCIPVFLNKKKIWTLRDLAALNE